MKQRSGKVKRRQLEFDVVRVQSRSNRFAARLRKHIQPLDGCFVYNGSRQNGYARMNFRHNGKHVSIHAHRVFLIIKLGRPIRIGYDAGHTSECRHRHCVLHVIEQHHTENAITDPTGDHFR